MDNPSPDWTQLVLQGLGALLMSGGGFVLGMYRTAKRADRSQQNGSLREREQLFEHYHALVAATREANETLRHEVSQVRDQLQKVHQENVKVLLEQAREREACRIENAQLRGDIKRLQKELRQLKAAMGHAPSEDADDEGDE